MAAPAVEHPADTPAPAPRARVLLLGRLALAAAGGLAVFLAYPPRSTWWLAPLGFLALGLLLRGARARAGFGYGFVFGMAFMVPLLAWTGEFVGVVAWLPLAAIQALLIALPCAGIAVVSRLGWWPLWAALLWVGGELLRAVVPFGGFPWGKVAFSQPEGWYLPLAGLGGTPLIAFAVALTGFAAAGLALTRRAVTALAVVGPLLAGFAWAPFVGVDAQDGEITVAAVQGNVPRAGLDFNAQRRAVLDNHVRRTEELAADVAAGRVPRPDLVIWPENSSDIDPYRNPDARAAINRAADAVGVPITVGAVLVDPDRRPRNTVLLWDPVRGPIDEYTKWKLQPFGETMPMREFFRLFTSYVDRANNFRPGPGADMFTIDVPAAADGQVRLAVATCYEVAFDEVVRANVALGANLIAVPTNNATFGRTEMTYQQLAMDRVRAVEHGRAVVVSATSGVSAIVAPDGSVVASTGMFTPDALVERVPLRTATTMADRLGAWPERVMAVAGLVALALAVLAGRRARRTSPTAAPPASTTPASTTTGTTTDSSTDDGVADTADERT